MKNRNFVIGIIVALATILLALSSTLSNAQIPRTLSYQGVLTDSSGNPKPDNIYSITFRMYDGAVGGIVLWTEVKSLQVKRGLFTTILGDLTPLPDSLQFDRPYWLSLQVASEPELAPRLPLTAVGYSLYSLKADTARYALGAPMQLVVDSARIASSVPDNSITGGKISNDQVVRSINNKKDNITIAGQGGATVTSGGDTIYINAGSGGDSTGVFGIQNTNNTLDVINPNGPTVTVNVKNGIFLPLTGGTMTGAITNTGNPSITMGKANFGTGNTNTGGYAFVAGQNNTASGLNSAISGGINNIANIDRASVGGGLGNTSSGLSSRVGGGEGNTASGNTSTISGGLSNNAIDTSTTISGGENNIAAATGSTIGGGSLNRARGRYSVVSGGGGATLADSNSASGNYSTIGGGRENKVSGTSSTIAGGRSNNASGVISTIGGGWWNVASSDFSTVSGGMSNNATGYMSAVGGGSTNFASDEYAAVSGGYSNYASGWGANVSGGAINIASGQEATVSGGAHNTASGENSTASGGQYNSARGDYAVVSGGGGASSVDSNSAIGDYSTIGGGQQNSTSRAGATVGGGLSNHATSLYSTVGGGSFNRARGLCSVVSGGGGEFLADSNSATGNYSIVDGGRGNIASGRGSKVAGINNRARGECSVVSGGGGILAADSNSAVGTESTISGGHMNLASGVGSTVSGGALNDATGWFATVPGGSSNQASGNYSLAAGYRAKALYEGSFVWGDYIINTDVSSDTTNQFKIRASNGVNLESAAGSSKEIRKGDFYSDNAIIAWAKVTGGGTVDSKFGVQSVVRNSAGNYTIMVQVTANSAAQLIPMAIAEIDAEPSNAAASRIVSINQLTTNSFRVYIQNGNFAMTDNDFTVIVTGR